MHLRAAVLAGFAVLAQARGTVAENLGRLPNYTCTESIEQSERDGTGWRIRDPLNYRRVFYQNRGFVLPRGAELVVTDSDRAEKEAEPIPAKVSGPIQYAVLPEIFKAVFSLDTAIDWSTSASGDPVQGTLREAVQVNWRNRGAQGRGASLDFEGGHGDLAGRRNEVPVKGEPLIYRSSQFKLAGGDRLTLQSRLLKSVHNDSIRP